ncbi:hypothetical protein [Sphingomonas bacterium]|uniref:hypothetical protein n=1 Tax=Sphingomonas bacterium TaxID=1895847 RepID=UPI001C2D6122|nr:hypothetical protein [Sphingomonas bacterium]
MRKLLMTTGLGMAAMLAGCATGPTLFPVEATRFHYDPVADRGTILVEPVDPAGQGPEFQTYAAAVQAELVRLGYTPVAPGTIPQFRVTVSLVRGERPLPPRRSPVSIGIGGAGFSGGGGGYRGGGYRGGGYRGGGGGVGLGGGVSFPVGGGHGRVGVMSELDVRIKRGPDAVWEGKAQTMAYATAPDADAAATAARLAHALFTGFPGDSGRTIEVR